MRAPTSRVSSVPSRARRCELERPLPGTGIVRGVLIGSVMWALIILGIVAIFGGSR